MSSTDQRLSREELRPLMQKRDGPGLLRLGVQLALFAAAMIGVTSLNNPPLQWVGVVTGGVVLATFFPPLHEAGHKTAFATDWLNEAVVWLCAVLMLQAPAFFREFHWEHHRETQDPHADPEIAGAPALLDGWPGNPITWLLLVSGHLLMVGKALFTISSALLVGGTAWKKVFPFIRDKMRGRIAWQSRLVIGVWVMVIWLGFSYVPQFWMVLLMWPIAHVVLGFYLMPEHTGLAHDGSQSHRTRTVTSNGLVRWFMWNMPYHTEHHEYPAVPFHAVPRLHRLWDERIENRHRGYVSFHLEALRRAFRLGP